MAEQLSAQDELFGVRSRVCWGAILAGAVMSLACYLVLTLLGAAIGLSVADGVRETDGLATGAGIWAVATTVISLFLGGWIASQAVVGETKGEAILHSLVMWGVVMGMIMFLVAAGARAGFSAMVGYAQFVEADGRSGVVQDARQRADTAVADAERAINDPANRQVIKDRAAKATGWALLGTMLSIAAAVLGGYIGGGSAYRWFGQSVTYAGARTAVHGTGS